MFLTFEKAKELRAFSDSTTKTILESAHRLSGSNVFLSHSSKDKELIAGVIEFLENHGARVYIDKLDSELPNKTSAETAQKLKRRISQIPRFIYLVTPKTKDSRWMPWELGLADALLGSRSVAMLPVINSNSKLNLWTEQEYLEIYGRIGRWNFTPTGKYTWLVESPDDRNSATPLTEWLNT